MLKIDRVSSGAELHVESCSERRNLVVESNNEDGD